MRRHLLIALLLLLITGLFASARPGISQDRPRYAADIVKIKLSAEAVRLAQLPTGLYAEAGSFGINELDQLMSRIGGKKIIRAHRAVKDKAWEQETGFDRWFLIKTDGRVPVLSGIELFKANRFVEQAIPEYYAYTTAVPNDPYYANNWGHNNTAQLPVYTGGSHSGAGVGTIGFDSDAQLAWDQSQGYGSSSVIIAIIDTGVDTTHPDLRLMNGYDYGDNDSNPMDDSADPGHGTSCSGVAAGRANNSLGLTGVAGGCTVMPLKIASADGSLGFTAIENALTHAGDNGADVASMSFGAEGGMAEGSSTSTDAALEYAYSHGVTLLAATANSNTSTIAYPSNHNKVISVGASSPTGQRKSTTSSDGENWWGSNYGNTIQDDPGSVDICAPTILPSTDLVGSVGYSTTDYYMWFNGTSCATPYAAGVAALLISKQSSLTPAQVRTALVSTATDMTFDGGAGWDRYTGYGLVNANSALSSLIPGMPSCTITSPTSGSTFNIGSPVTVQVTATDTDGTISNVSFYLDGSATASYVDNSAPYSWTWDTTGVPGGAHSIVAKATDNSSLTAQSTISLTLLAPANEGFETGNFSAYPWTQTTIPWTVQSTDVFSGTYAAKSGTITDSGTTTMTVPLTINTAGNITFYYKVSSESGYDYLKFYLDGTQMGSWSGTVAWTSQSYPVTTGSHTFAWSYTKDGSVSSGSDCAWVDHIIFPPHTIPSVYNPPQNLVAAPGNGVVNLSWSAPASGTPTGYRIYRGGSLLTTVTGLSYADNAVVNGTTYSYYLIATYSGGNSDPTPTVNATPTSSTVSEAIIGTGTTVTGTTTACPINIYYKSLHGQAIYTRAELNAAGIYGPINITQLGFYISTVPTLALPSFVVRMKHTADATVTNWQTATDMQTVYSNASYMPVAGGYQMLTLSTPFLWNGTGNLVVDTAFGLVANYYSTGTVQYSTVTDGYRFTRSDTADQTSIFAGGSILTSRPNIKFVFSALEANPQISVNQTALSFGSVAVGASSATQSFTITNTGGGTLSGTITSPTAFPVTTSAKDARSTVNFSLGAGLSATYNAVFSPTTATAYSGNIVITSNSATQSTYNIAVSGTGYIPPTIVVDATQLAASLVAGEGSDDFFTISNTGTQALNYTIGIAEVSRFGGTPGLGSQNDLSTKSIAGTTFTLNTAEYTPGSTVDWTFTVYNASTDSEWLEDIYLTLPAGITFNSVTTFSGGTAAMTPDVTSGTGGTIHWNGSDTSGWGVIHGGETALATVNVTIPTGMITPISLAYQINGDVYGAEPHILNGTIELSPALPPMTWFTASPLTGSIAGGGNQAINGHFSALGLSAGLYEALLSISSNDPVHPIKTVQILLEVTPANSAPVITPPPSLSFTMGNQLVVNFDSYISDADGDPLTLRYEDNTNISVQIVGHTVTFSAPAYWVGSENIAFFVSDGVLESNAVIPVSVLEPASLDIPNLTVVGTETGCRLSWDAVPNANHYNVFISDAPDGVYQFLGTTQELFYDSVTETPTGFFRVTAELIPID